MGGTGQVGHQQYMQEGVDVGHLHYCTDMYTALDIICIGEWMADDHIEVLGEARR